MPEITEVFYPRERSEWRAWLEEYHQNKTEVWLQMWRKDTGKPTLPYDDLVEECLCFGWIDGVVKKHGEGGRVQRITPRRPKKSYLSELNRQRFWKLEHLGLMTPAGYAPAIVDQIGKPTDPFEIPAWISEQLQADPTVWETFQSFSHFYQRLKVGWIAEAGTRREVAEQRLAYLIKMTAQAKQYGTRPLAGIQLG
ncbi:MAG: YdeI/OmpD-associated family protein [Bacteroidota bacterium]